MAVRAAMCIGTLLYSIREVYLADQKNYAKKIIKNHRLKVIATDWGRQDTQTGLRGFSNKSLVQVLSCSGQQLARTLAITRLSGVFEPPSSYVNPRKNQASMLKVIAYFESCMQNDSAAECVSSLRKDNKKKWYNAHPFQV